MSSRWSLLLCFTLAFLARPAHAGDWPQFRGPGGTGVSAETKLPAEWDAKKNIAWKIKLPGYGWSSPIVWGDKVFVTTAVSNKQAKPAPGFGGFGGGGRGPRGGRGGFFPQPGQILSPFTQDQLNVTDKQKKQIQELQKEVDTKLGKIFTDDQNKQLKEMRDGLRGGGFGRGGRGGRGGFGGFGNFPLPGQILAASV